jgi:hypothetical protein
MSTELLKNLIDFRLEGLPSGVETTIAQLYYECLDTPISLGLWLRLKYGEHDSLSTYVLPIHQLDDRDTDRWRRDYLSACFLSKAEWLNTTFNLEEDAFNKFLMSEESCRMTNERFRKFSEGAEINDCAYDVRAILHSSSLKIANILGEVPRVSDLNFHFGPGSSSSVGGERTSPYEKVLAEVELTTNCLPLLPLYESIPCWKDSQTFPGQGVRPSTIIKGSKLLFVPKSAKSLRSICIEPLLNGYFQLGFGTYMRDRLKTFGVDLNDQSKNANLAKVSSRDGILATLDMSAASDSIAYLYVMDQLPVDWFQVLDATRSPITTYCGRDILLEKFSSMGNGYTFELESLLFYSLACSTVEYYGGDRCSVSIYGDDLIVPVKYVNHVIGVFAFCGFSMNMSKSFWTGYFRESCGAHWFRGLDVKPLYQKKEIQNAADLYKLCNAVRRLSARGMYYSCDKRYKPLWDYIIKLLRQCRVPILRGPDGYGDGFIVSNFEESRPVLRGRSTGFYHYRCESLCEVGQYYEPSSPAAHYAYALYATGQSGYDRPEVDRRSITTRLSIKGLIKAPKALRNALVALVARQGEVDNFFQGVPLRRNTKRKIGSIIIPAECWNDLGPWY